MHRLGHLAAAVALLPAAVTAQRGWDIPHRGALVYDRTTTTFAVTPAASRLRLQTLIPPAAAGGYEWRHLACAARDIPAGFEAAEFDDSGWPRGRGEFSPDAGKAAHQRSRWATEALCLRTTVDIPRRPKALVFAVDHDDGLRIWLNGHLVVSNDGYGRGRRYVISGDALASWQRGDNLLAARCINIGGAQYCDIGVETLLSLPPRVRAAADIEQALNEARDAAAKVRRELFGGYRVPALVLQGELDPKGEHVEIPPADLRDVAWFVATDLRAGSSGGTVSADASRMFRLGDLEIRGRAGVVGADGWQRVEVRVENTAAPELRGDSKRHVERHVAPFVWYGFEGELVIDRRFEVGEGGIRIAEWNSELEGQLLRGKDWKEHVANLSQRETWRLQSVRDGQDGGFRALVKQALDQGVQRLRAQLADVAGGDIAPENKDADRTYASGRLALGLLALIKGGLPKDDEIVQQGLAELRRRRLIDTYSLGNALMAMEAYYAPSAELGDLRSGAIDQPRKRAPNPDDRALMQQWTDELLTNLDTRVDPAYLLRFHYIGAADFDNSVNQYGLLGLYSAHLCGIEIPVQTWEAAINHLLASQAPAERSRRTSIDLVDYRAFARSRQNPGETRTGSKITARPLGWSYKEARSGGVLAPTWGSMTCAGITGLAICQAALADHPGLQRVRLDSDATRARLDGFAWLAKHMTARCHAGAIERQRRWFYYYLYSLERAALLSGIALIQDRDWYFEGAMVLVLAQNADGNWPGELLPERALETNAMAILFLKQSTLPVLTGK